MEGRKERAMWRKEKENHTDTNSGGRGRRTGRKQRNKRTQKEGGKQENKNANMQTQELSKIS